MQNWKESSHPAHMEEILEDGYVRCHLSPRNCKIPLGGHGFCGVRANREGRLVSLNYGKSVHPTEETIETEAVNHYAPGERIMSFGNIGCMMNCSYCHNWKTSQARYVSDKDVFYMTPEQAVQRALDHGIRVMSWTYNDPVVWHEFILDAAKLAKEAGMINLYKSAFFITQEAIEELLPVIDIFSVSIKSMDEDYYRKITTGWLQPVLDGTKQVFDAGKHVEVSTLMVTDLSDNEEVAARVANWVLGTLDENVPMHYVRFHPDYKMTDTIRTPVDRLIRARQVALDLGVKHVYLGNVYDTDYSNTFCRKCNALLVDRYGLNATTPNLTADGNCAKCGEYAHIKLPFKTSAKDQSRYELPASGYGVKSFDWHGDIRSVHVLVQNASDEVKNVYHCRIFDGEKSKKIWEKVELKPGESYRFIVAKGHRDERGCSVAIGDEINSNLHEVFDRAHFPTVSVDEASADTDITPLPSLTKVAGT